MTSVNNLNIFTFIKDIYQSLKHIDKTSTVSNDILNKRITKLEENQQILIDKCTTIEILINKLGENNTTQNNLDKTLEFELLEKMKKLNQNEINNEKLSLRPEELTFANVIENNYNFTDINESISNNESLFNNSNILPLDNNLNNLNNSLYTLDTSLYNSLNHLDNTLNILDNKNIKNNNNTNTNNNINNNETLDSLLFSN